MDYIEYNGQQYKDNFSGIFVGDTGKGKIITFKIKMKQNAYFVNMPTTFNVEPLVLDGYFSPNNEYTLKITEDHFSDLDGIPFVFSRAFNAEYENPDFFFVSYSYIGE